MYQEIHSHRVINSSLVKTREGVICVLQSHIVSSFTREIFCPQVEGEPDQAAGVFRDPRLGGQQQGGGGGAETTSASTSSTQVAVQDNAKVLLNPLIKLE